MTLIIKTAQCIHQRIAHMYVHITYAMRSQCNNLLLHRKFQHAEEDDIDTPDVSIGSCGEEWPKSEHPDVARYRKFYQVGCGD